MKSLSKYYPWLIWLLGSLFFFYKYLVQVSPSVMTSELMQAFNVHGIGLGNLSACYFYAYLIMQIPVGMLLDKYSPRLLTTAAILLCAIATFFFSQTDSLFFASLTRALMGMGAAFAAVSCFKQATLWFKPERFALISGLCMTAAMLGGVGGQIPLAYLMKSFDWRTVLSYVSYLGLGLALVYWLIVRDKALPEVKKTAEGFHLKAVLKNRQTWILSLYSGLAFAPVSVFGGLWGVPFLEIAAHLAKEEAAFAVSGIFIGFAAGAPFFGWLSDYMGTRKPILFMSTFVAFLCISAVIYLKISSLTFLTFLLFGFGFGVSGFFTSFAMIRELFPLFLGGTVLGVMNTFDSVCEALFEPLVGAVLDWTWAGAMIDGVHHFNLLGYKYALSLLPLSLLLALFLTFFIKETYCTPVD